MRATQVECSAAQSSRPVDLHRWGAMKRWNIQTKDEHASTVKWRTLIFFSLRQRAFVEFDSSSDPSVGINNMQIAGRKRKKKCLKIASSLNALLSEIYQLSGKKWIFMGAQLRFQSFTCSNDVNAATMRFGAGRDRNCERRKQSKVNDKEIARSIFMNNFCRAMLLLDKSVEWNMRNLLICVTQLDTSRPFCLFATLVCRSSLNFHLPRVDYSHFSLSPLPNSSLSMINLHAIYHKQTMNFCTS